MKKYVFEDKMGETHHVKADNEQDAWEKLTKLMGCDEYDRDMLADDFTLKTNDMRPSASSEWFQATAVNKQQCEEYGGIWVSSYHKKDGNYVRGYCRKRGR